MKGLLGSRDLRSGKDRGGREGGLNHEKVGRRMRVEGGGWNKGKGEGKGGGGGGGGAVNKSPMLLNRGGK